MKCGGGAVFRITIARAAVGAVIFAALAASAPVEMMVAEYIVHPFSMHNASRSTFVAANGLVASALPAMTIEKTTACVIVEASTTILIVDAGSPRTGQGAIA